MELRQLEYFQAVSRLKNITRAAEKMYVTQPTITLAIQRLEEELGVVLFDRSQRNFMLTAEGHVFLKHIDSILQGLKDAIIEMQDHASLQKGSIKLGLPPMVGTFFLPTLFIDFQKQYPAVEITTVEAGSMSIRELLKNGEIDIGIVVITEPEPQLNTLPIAKGEIHACLSTEHPLSKETVLSFDQLRNESFVLIPDGTYVRRTIAAEFKRNNIIPRIILSSGQVETLLRLVKKGVAISFLIDFIARQYPDIAVIPLSNPLPIEIGLAWKKDKSLSYASRAFVDFMIRSVQVDAAAKSN